MPRMGESRPDVGRRAAGDAHQLVEGRREDVVRVAPGGPDLVELPEVEVHDRAQGSRMAERRHAAGIFCNPRRAGDLVRTEAYVTYAPGKGQTSSSGHIIICRSASALSSIRMTAARRN